MCFLARWSALICSRNLLELLNLRWIVWSLDTWWRFCGSRLGIKQLPPPSSPVFIFPPSRLPFQSSFIFITFACHPSALRLSCFATHNNFTQNMLQHEQQIALIFSQTFFSKPLSACSGMNSQGCWNDKCSLQSAIIFFLSSFSHFIDSTNSHFRFRFRFEFASRFLSHSQVYLSSMPVQFSAFVEYCSFELSILSIQ